MYLYKYKRIVYLLYHVTSLVSTKIAVPVYNIDCNRMTYFSIVCQVSH